MISGIHLIKAFKTEFFLSLPILLRYFQQNLVYKNSNYLLSFKDMFFAKRKLNKGVCVTLTSPNAQVPSGCGYPTSFFSIYLLPALNLHHKSKVSYDRNIEQSIFCLSLSSLLVL